jgi:hypothetical protein
MWPLALGGALIVAAAAIVAFYVFPGAAAVGPPEFVSSGARGAESDWIGG